jgi:excinuclease ABC subunit A
VQTIEIRGAREHNLDSIDLSLPRGALIAVTGPSGSGKSSLALDTVHAEGQRRLIEALGAARLLRLSRPDVDLITGLPPTIGLSQLSLATSRSTVGTLTETSLLLRTIAAHEGLLRCPACGRAMPVHTAEQITAELLGQEGARLTLLAPLRRGAVGDLGRLLDELHRQGFARILLNGEQHLIEEAPPVAEDQAHDLDLVIDRIRIEPRHRERLFSSLRTGLSAGQGQVIAMLSTSTRAFADHPRCPEDGTTLPAPTPRAIEHPDQLHLGDASLSALESMSARALAAHLAGLSLSPAGSAVRAELSRRLGILQALSLGHLPLQRSSTELSTGELSRTRLAGCTANELSGVLYVIDEPTAGLHPDDLPPVLDHLRGLVDAGNTALVIDHHPSLLSRADLQVRFGPGAGPSGGRVLHCGPPEAAVAPPLPAPTPATVSGEVIRLTGASGGNLAGVDAVFPRQKWTVICGVSGSGKSTLLSRTLAPAIQASLGLQAEPLPFTGLTGLSGIRRLLLLERTPPGRQRRSITATAAGLWTPIRGLLASTRSARIRGFSADRFSFNRPGGRCEACQGMGRQPIELDYLPGADVVCEVCEGRRFDRATLSVEFKGATVHDILEMSVDDARRHFASQPRILRILTALSEVGLGYLPLGQTADTLSGGEGQRIRLAAELSRAVGQGLEDMVAVLDEPAAALHPTDAGHITAALRRLVSRGATLITVAYQPGLLAAADHLIVMGPGAGPAGGRILSAGPPGL